MKVRGTKYTTRYGVCPVQCGGHVDWDDQDVVGNDAGSDMAYRFVTWYVMGPALIVGAYDACVVTVNDDAAIMEPGVYDNEDHKFEGNGLSPADIPAFSFPSRCEGPCNPFIAEGNANAPAGRCIDP